ncbi:MAG: hypothetical protein WA876_01090 [Candidatus Acidiferrales bacterium]
MSKGLFSTDEIFVQGFSWCKDGPRKIGINNFTRKILCSRHNTELSAADDAAIDTARKFREAFRLYEVRQTLRPTIWTVTRFRIDVYGLERWFLKTLINIALGQDRFIGAEAERPGEPPRRLVEIAFGRETFRERAGLYVFVDIGQNIHHLENRVTVTTFSPLNDSLRLLGATFVLQGFTYLLCLDETGVSEGVTFLRPDGTPYAPGNVWYRKAHIRYQIRKRLSHTIDIECD